MNNVRMRKSVFYTLCRSGLICLLFLMPWLSGNLQAQPPFLGTVGIDTNNGNDKAVLNILDDDNLKDTNNPATPVSIQNRTVVLKKVSNYPGGFEGVEGLTPGSTGSPVEFKVHFQNVGATLALSTTAVEDVWVTFDIVDGANPSATVGDAYTHTNGVDFKFPALVAGELEKVAGHNDRRYRVRIPAKANESMTISLPVYGDKHIEGTEQFEIRLIEATTLAGHHIPSDIDNQTDFPVYYNASNPYIFKIQDKTGDNPDNTRIKITPAGPQTIYEGGPVATITVSLPDGVTSVNDIVVPVTVYMDPHANRASDFKLTQDGTSTNNSATTFTYPVTIKKSKDKATFDVSAALDYILYDDGTVTFKLDGTPPTGYGWSTVAAEKQSVVKIEDRDKNDYSRTALELYVTQGEVKTDGVDNSTIHARFKNTNVTTAEKIEIKLDRIATSEAIANTHYAEFLPANVTIGAGQKNSGVTAAGNAGVKVTSKLTKVIGGRWRLDVDGTLAGHDVAETYMDFVDQSHKTTNNLKITFDPVTPTVQEGSDQVIKVKLPDGYTTAVELTIPVRVDAALSTLTVVHPGSSGADYSIDPAISTTSGVTTVKIPKNANNTSFKFSALQDAEVEADELVYVVGDGAVTGSVGYTHTVDNQAKITIQDMPIAGALDIAVEFDKYTVERSISATGADKVKITATLTTEFSKDVTITFSKDALSTLAPNEENFIPSTKQIVIGHGDKTGSLDIWVSCNLTEQVVKDLVLSAQAQADGISGLQVKFKNNISTIKVNPSAIGNVIKSDNNKIAICEATPSFFLTAPDVSGSITTYTYNWYQNGTLMTTASGKGKNKFEVPVANTYGNYTYEVQIISEFGCERTSNVFALQIYQLPESVSITSTTPEGEICGTPNVTITSKTDESNPTYIWYRKDGSNPEVVVKTGMGVANSTYVVPGGQNGKYWLEIKNANGCISTSNTLGFTFDPAGTAPATPVVTPTGPVTYCDDGSIPGSVTLTANPVSGPAYDGSITYKWYKEGASADDTYAVIKGNNTISIKEAGKYLVVVSKNGCLSSESNVVEVNKSATAALPQPKTVVDNEGKFCENGSVTLRITNVSDYVNNQKFQWYRTPLASGPHAGIAGGAIAGANGASHAADLEGDYYVVAVGTCSSLPSEPALRVELSGNSTSLEAPVVLPDNNPTTYCTGGSVTLTVQNVAGGATYQWHSNSGPITDGTGNGTSYHAKADGTYWVVATDGSGCQSKASNKVLVASSGGPAPIQPKIIAKDDITNICAENGSIELKAVKHNGQPYVAADNITKYEWYLNNNLIDVTASNVYHALGSDKSGKYSVKVYSGSCESLPSADLDVTVSPGTGAPDQPRIEGIDGGTVVEICDGANSGGTGTILVKNPQAGLTYYWYGDKQGDLGVIGASYAASKVDFYYVVAKDVNDCYSVPSNKVEVKSSGNTNNITKPQLNATQVSFCENGSVTLTIDNANDPYYTLPANNVTFQWHGRKQGMLTGPLMNGSSIVVSVEDFYWVVAVSGSCQSEKSNEKEVVKSGTTDLVTPTTKIEGNAEICIGGTATIVVTNVDAIKANHPNVKFQWYNEKGIVDDATDLPFYIASKAGEYYVVAIDAPCQSKPSSPAEKITVGGSTNTIPDPAIEVDPASKILCIDGSIKLTAINSGTGLPYDDNTLTYKWYVNGVRDDNANGPVYLSTKDGVHTVVVLDGQCQSKEASETIIKGSTQAPKTADISGDNTLCIGGSAVLNATPREGVVTDYTYEWYLEGQPIAGANGSTHAADKPGNYTVVVVSGSCRSVASPVHTVVAGSTQALDQPKILPDGDQEYCINGSVRLEAVSSVTGKPYSELNLTYIWYNSAGQEKQRGASPVYNASEAGYYYVIVDNGCPSLQSALKKVSQGTTTTFLNQPEIVAKKGTAICGELGTIELTAQDGTTHALYTQTGLVYEWYRDNVPVYKGVSHVYHALGSDIGAGNTAVYTVKVFESAAPTACGSAVSAGIPVTVGNGTVIPSQPVIKGINGGTVVEICDLGKPGATGTILVEDPQANLTYHWYHDKDGDLGVTGASYAASKIGFYYVVAEDINGCYSIPSNEVEVKSSGNSNGLDQPILDNTTVSFCENGSVTLTISNATAYGSGVTFQWHGKKQGMLTGALMNGSSVVVSVADIYWVVAVDGTCQSAKSNEKEVVKTGLTQLKQPKIATDGDKRDICIDGSLTLKITNIGDFDKVTYPNIKFQWYNEKGAIINATEASYTATVAGTYYVVAIDAPCQSVPSNEITLNMGSTQNQLAQPIIEVDPASAEFCDGGSVELTAKSSDPMKPYNNVTYRWFVDGVEDTSVKGAVYIASVAANYKVVVSDGDCESLPAYQQVSKAPIGNAPNKPEILTENGTSFCTGGSVVIRAIDGTTKAPYGPGVKFRWYYEGDPIIGATGESLAADKEGYYFVVALLGDCHSNKSESVKIVDAGGKALDKPIIEPLGTNVEFCKNGSIKLTVKSSGTPYEDGVKYIWFKNGTELHTTTSKDFNVDEAGTYHVVVDNGCPSVKSDDKVVSENTLSTALDQPKIIVDPATQEVCINGSVKLTAISTNVAYPTTGLKYEWYKNEHIVATTDVNFYHAPWVAGDTEVYYTVKVYDGAGCQTKVSDAVKVTTNTSTAPGQPKIVNITGDICINGMSILQVETPVAGATYEWHKDEVYLTTTTAPEYHATQTGLYYVVVVDGGCRSIPSDKEQVNSSGTQAPNAPTIAPANVLICDDGTVELAASPSGMPTYLWFKDGALVKETTTNTYRVNAAGDYTVAIKDGSCLSKESGKSEVRSSGNQAAPAPTITGTSMVCSGMQAVLTANSSAAGITGYTWYRDGVNIGTTAANTITVSTAGNYTVVVVTGTGAGKCETAESAAHPLTVSTDPDCMSSLVTLSVDHDTLTEGEQTKIWAKLPQGITAQSQMKIVLDFSGSATLSTTGCTANSLGLKDYYINSAVLEIVIPQNGYEASVDLITCKDYTYETTEEIIISGTYNNATVTGSPCKITLLDYDADGPDNDKLRLLWELQATGHPGGPAVVNKGQTATFELTAYHPSENVPIAVQKTQKVGLEYSTDPNYPAVPDVNYTQKAWGEIAAGTQSTLVYIVTYDDNVIHKNDLQVISEVEPIHEKVHAVTPILYIRSLGLNANGGFDFNVTLTPNAPAQVSENGGEFTLTIALTDLSYTVGDDVVFDVEFINTALSNMAKAGVDYTIPAEIVGGKLTLRKGTNTVSVVIRAIDNDVFDGTRQLDIRVTPVDVNDVIVNAVPGNPMTAYILDDDKLCITVTEKDGKMGIDDYDKTATVVVEVHNLSPVMGGVVLQLSNTNALATHYQTPVNEFITPITLTANPSNPKLTHEFTITSTLVPSSGLKQDFVIASYTSVWEEMMIEIVGIQSGAVIFDPANDLDCYEPLPLVISDDYDQDGIPNWVERKVEDPTHPDYCADDTGDSNGNGILNEWDPYDPNADDDGDGIPNWMEDTNRDGNPYNDFAGSSCLPNFANPDSDGDGVPDSVENWTNRPYDNNNEEIRIHPALSLNEDGIGNDRLYIENIHKYTNKVTVFDRQGLVVWEETDYRNDSDKAFRGISKKTKKKVPMGTYFVIVEYTTKDGKKYYDKAVEVRY